MFSWVWKTCALGALVSKIAVPYKADLSNQLFMPGILSALLEYEGVLHTANVVYIIRLCNSSLQEEARNTSLQPKTPDM